MNKIKLKPKQLAVLQQIQAEKAQISKMFQSLNEKETLVLELVFEENGVTTTEIKDVKLEQDTLTFDYVVAVEPKEKKKKKEVKFDYNQKA